MIHYPHGVRILGNYKHCNDHQDYTLELLNTMGDAQKIGIMDRVIRMMKRLEFIANHAPDTPVPDYLKD